MESDLFNMKQCMKQIRELVIQDHHKQRDGVILFEYDVWDDEWFCKYGGYALGDFEFTTKTLQEALKKARDMLEDLIRDTSQDKNEQGGNKK